MSNTSRSLAKHITGDLYIVEHEAVWHGSDCVGARIVAAAGPIYYRDLGHDGGPLTPSAILFDRIDAWPNLTDDDAAFLQAEEGAGRLTYPIGGRA